MGNWLFGSSEAEESKILGDYKLQYCDDFGGPYTHKLTLFEQKLYWEKKCMHSIGVSRVCPKCGESSASYCSCAKTEEFDALTNAEILKIKDNQFITCDKCNRCMLLCDCEYQE